MEGFDARVSKGQKMEVFVRQFWRLFFESKVWGLDAGMEKVLLQSLKIRVFASKNEGFRASVLKAVFWVKNFEFRRRNGKGFASISKNLSFCVKNWRFCVKSVKANGGSLSNDDWTSKIWGLNAEIEKVLLQSLENGGFASKSRSQIEDS